MSPKKKFKHPNSNQAKYTFHKKSDLFYLLKKIKLWPSRVGLLHGIKSIDINSTYADILLHCGHQLTVKNSKNSRAARWLRNKWMVEPCKRCAVPDWKLEKYRNTTFK
ncbi:pyrrolysine--tRNA(Pyl) ligase small subunit [Natroniella acetigena]|uniref:pyrrolysine--tRNA(Pyl) ligase small subunit n=1 Tax=Natroniella acetigena TaxID=52004 RepID=UPI00200AE355|nr:pyrrolysine--tRNA(Pyl) ligase small subunit [Natroniella acetigena]MCK8827440.1 pyrrolysine--tRNA(Pyl) ligase small subunit [Natroniella acetigena]